jgi:hypothetical protein
MQESISVLHCPKAARALVHESDNLNCRVPTKSVVTVCKCMAPHVTYFGYKLAVGWKQQPVIPFRNRLLRSNRLFVNLPLFLSI